MLYQELQPVDTFKIKMASPFSDYDRQLLTLFYQPLIGPQAMSLFMSFWADAECEKETEYNHYYLMNLLTMPLGQVFEARISLEAIGLLRTYCKQEEHDRVFIYELLPPMDAKSFFDDPLLSTFLFSKIGEQAYRGLRNRFLEDHSLDESYKEVSRTFLDVYKPIRFAATERMDETTGEMRGRNESSGIPFAYSDFDFNLLRAGLSEQMVPKASLASVSKELIEKLAFLYSLTPIDMQKVVMMALDENLKLPEERLRKSAVDYYKMNISQNVPMIEKAFKKEEPVKAQEPATREDELLFYLESTSPREMLRDLNGREPFPVDIQLAERLINTHGLSIGVVNVLLQYMILRNDGKITNNFAERIASHWSNKKVTSAKVAMDLSRTEHDQYMKWLNEGKQKPAGRKPTREEKVPEWFYKKEGTEKQEQETNTDPAIDEKRRQLMEKLDAMRTGVK
ncbi:replication initiation and membrane attachment protein [Sporosarcina luteola]|uniref:Replication initiation and membrane attachment protein n=1 Tax=Sporosarcina luteola TaxID=582850 RepID=A0A511Z467_9BACL|nr:DnaD domain protein [Sporosarcina luteola]GEN82241.1 replication initiation and membrane attachment protein [Sporosarcina luteola]